MNSGLPSSRCRTPRSIFGRSPAALGPEEIRAYQVYLTNEKKLASSSLVIAVCALRFLYKGHAQEGVVARRRDPGAEKAVDLTGGAQPRRSGPVSRLHQETQASHDPDDLLCGRPTDLRSRAAHPPRDR